MPQQYRSERDFCEELSGLASRWGNRAVSLDFRIKLALALVTVLGAAFAFGVFGMLVWIIITDQIEAPVKGALVGLLGASTTAVVALTVFGGTLWWNRRKHQEDAEFAIRKDVYLNYVDAVNGVMTYLGTFYVGEMTIDEGTRRIAVFGAATTRIHATAGPETISVAMSFQQRFLEQWQTVVLHRKELDRLADEINAHQKECSELCERAYQMSQSPILSAQAQEIRPMIFELYRSSSDQQKLKEEKICLRQKAHVAAVSAAHELLFALEPLQIEILLFARKELRMPIDAEWYKQKREAQTASVKAFVKQTVQ